jgi:hypothetical protein
MANEKVLNTIIVLRNDSSTNWADSDVILQEGETGISYLDNGNVMVKVGNGVDAWADLPQVESVLENDVLLTYSVGRHTVPTGSYKNAGGKDMTFSQWFIDAHKETVEPTITQPNVSLSASAANTGANLEIGSYITQLKWDGSSSNGSYSIGGATQSTGISSSDFTWSVSNNQDAQTSTSMDGSFTLTSDKYLQIISDSSLTYATVSATVTLDPSKAVKPKNNLGEETDGKIVGFDTEGTVTKTLAANVNATGFRNSWYYVGTDYTSAVDSDFFRNKATAKNANTTSFGTVTIPAGTKRVAFAVVGNKTLKSVIDVDGQGLDVKANFTKETVAIKGANDYDAIDYTVFHFENENGIAATKYTVSIG